MGTASEFVGTVLLQHVCQCGGASRKIL